MPLLSRLLLVALMGVGVYSGCRAPNAEVTLAANADVQPEAPATGTLDNQVPLTPEGAHDNSFEPTQPTADVCDVSSKLAEPPASTTTTQAATPDTYSVIDEQESAQYSVTGDDLFRSASLPNQSIDFDEQALLNVLQATRRYFAEQGCQDPKILQAGVMGTQKISVSDRRLTSG